VGRDSVPGISEGRRGRHPAWEADELILAVDLYLDYGLIDDTDQRVIELSRTLNALQIHGSRPDAERFRNPNGVARMKIWKN
jgi:5-methylcytosine-specific restriction protein A